MGRSSSSFYVETFCGFIYHSMTLSLFSNYKLLIVITKEMDPKRILNFFFLCGHRIIDVSVTVLVSEVSLFRIILYD
jgi:hypothetical protein